MAVNRPRLRSQVLPAAMPVYIPPYSSQHEGLFLRAGVGQGYNITRWPAYWCNKRMAASDGPPTKVFLCFHSLDDLSAFKNECACNDFYIDRDALTLVGSFTEPQLKIATGKYQAVESRVANSDDPVLGL